MRLYNLTMKVNRLEMLKANIGLELLKGTSKLERFFSDILEGRTMDELKRQAGILGKTIQNNADLAHSIVNASFHNATFSQRLWMYNNAMKADIDKLITSGLISGKNGRELAKSIRKYYIGEERLKNGKKGAIFYTERLMRTELARVQTDAQKKSFEKNGFELYRFHVNGGCCPICADVANSDSGYGKGVYKLDDLMAGTNAAPMHPFCRCAISPYEDSEEYEAWIEFLDAGGTTRQWDEYKKAMLMNVGKNIVKSTNSSEKIVQTGGKENTGGKWYIPYNENDNRDAKASKEYRKISRRNDTRIIAENTGFSEEDIKQIKRHIFYNKHQTYDGYKTLYPDYDMAVAWNRLYKGEFLDRDILLLKHELLESTLEKEYNLTIAEAHSRASKKYDWAKKIESELGMDGEPDGLL